MGTNATQKKQKAYAEFMKLHADATGRTTGGESDDKFIDSFLIDSQNYLRESADRVGNIGWKDSQDTGMKDNRSYAADLMAQRSGQVRSYLDNHRDEIDPARYQKMDSYLRNFDSDLQKIGQAFQNKEQYYSQWESEEAYNQAQEAQRRERMRKSIEDTVASAMPTVAKQQYEAAQKEYDAYVNSEEYRANQLQKMVNQSIDATKASGISTPYAAAAQKPTSPQVDEKEKELRAARDYYKQLYDAEEDAITHEANMKEIASLSDEDRNQLQQYIESRDKRRSFFVNDITWFQEHNKEKENEKALIEKYGKDRLDRLAEAYGRYLHEQNAEKTIADAQGAVNKNALSATGANIVSIPARALGGIEALTGRLYEQVDRTGQYKTLETYTAGDELSLYGNVVMSQTAENIAGDQYDEQGNKVSDGGALRQGLAYAYQGGMSLADSLARLAVGGEAGSLGLAALSSFGQTMSEASKQGATPQQAVVLAVGTAALEAATEKIPLDEMLKAAKGGAKGAMAIAGEALKQAGIEATTEEISLFGSLLLEAGVLREKSSYNQQIGAAIANGATYDEAKAQADKAIWNEALQTAAVSGFSGLFSGGGSAAMGSLNSTDAQTLPQTEQTAEAAPETAVPQTQAQTEVAPKSKEQEVADTFADMVAAKSPKMQAQQAAQAQKNTAMENGSGNGLREYTQREKDNWKSSKRIVLFEGVEQFKQFIRNALTGDGSSGKKMYFGAISDGLAAKIGAATNLSVSGYNLSLGENEIRKISKSHGNEAREAQRGQRAVTETDYLNIPNIIQNADEITRSQSDYNGKPAIEFRKRYGNEVTTVVAVVSDKRLDVFVQTEYINKKSGSIATPEPVQADSFTPVATGGTAPVTEAEPSLSGDAEASRFTSTTKAKSDTVLTDIVPEGGAEVKGTGAAEANFSEQGEVGTVGGKRSQFKHEVKKSQLYENTYQNATGKGVLDIGIAAEAANPNIADYDAITEKESFHNAVSRTRSQEDVDAEYDYLLQKGGWSGEDNDTAILILNKLQKAGDSERLTKLALKQKEETTKAAQMVQSFAKYSRQPTASAAADAMIDMDGLKEEDVSKRFYNKNGFDNWKGAVKTSILAVANDIDAVEDGDREGMLNIVRQMANLRHTTAWAGYSSELSKRTERGLDKMDFDTLKTVAKTQLSMIPSDFRKRSAGEIAKQMRVQNMLFTLATKFKNDTGNISNGLMDAVSDSFGGRMIDALLGKITKVRTVGNDLKYAKEYTKAARDAADVAGAFVSLDIPMELEKYGGGTRTWSPNAATMLGRLMSAYEKHLKYALEVSDKFYEGGATHVVSKSLQDLGEKSGLSADDIQSLAQKTGARRTFKDPGYAVGKNGQAKKGRAFARANVGIQRALNSIGTENIGAGDLLMPFAAVSAEVKQTGMDYTGAGMISGLTEMISIVQDAKKGKEIDPYRQRSAATNFGRGLTGAMLTGIFAGIAYAGLVKVHNDRDSEERTMDQSQGLSGAQWNLGGTLRWIKTIAEGGSIAEANQAAGEWQKFDELLTVDFLEPFNTQMHIGYLLSQGTPLPQAVLQGSFEALLEMPMMQTLSDLYDLTQAFTEVTDGDMGGVYDAAGQLLGTVAGSAVPNWARKTAQLIDPYYRDTYSTNPLEKAIKQTISGIPFASTTLPKKYDNLGNEQRRYEEGELVSAAVDSMVTPWDTDTYMPEPVYQEIERLNEANKAAGVNATPPQPKRKITYTDKSGVTHTNYALTGQEYEKLSQVQGQTAKQILERVIQNSDYKKMTDTQKAYTIQAVYEYAQEQGKKAALPDYYSKADAWVIKTKETDTGAFIAQGAKKQLNSVISSVVNDLSNNWEVSQASKNDLDSIWKSYSGMTRSEKNQIMDSVSGDSKKFLQSREAGVSTEKYIGIKDALDSIVAETGHSNARAVQKAETIARSTKLTESQKTALIKLEVSDAQDENIDEVKKLGYTAADYAKLYRDYEDYTSGKGKKDRTIEKWMKDYKIDYAAAEALYKVFS